MTIFWICSAITVIAALYATFAGDIRSSILALWAVGLGAGGIYLSLGAEFLAIVQWMVATLIAIGFLVHAVTYGEYGAQDSRPASKRILAAVFPAIVGSAFGAMIWLGVSSLPSAGLFEPVPGPNLAGLGKTLVERHLLSLELLVLTLFVVLVGAGVIARPDPKEKP
jgi:NADH:ubiquinone oxidoreductase subunit 6 (subunit J)